MSDSFLLLLSFSAGSFIFPSGDQMKKEAHKEESDRALAHLLVLEWGSLSSKIKPWFALRV